MSQLILGGKPYDIKKELQHNEGKMELKEFWELFSSDLPLIILVAEGWMGSHEFDEFETGEVYWISHSSTQKRVVARDYGAAQYISIPLDYSVNVAVLDSNFEEVERPTTLHDVVARYKLPINVRVVNESSYGFFSLSGSCSFDVLRLTQMYDERYLLCNMLSQEGITWSTASVMPLYLPVAISIVTKPNRVDAATWKDFCKIQIKRQSSACDYSNHPVNKDIMVFSAADVDRSEGIYDYIEPRFFVKYREKRLAAMGLSARKESSVLVVDKTVGQNLQKKRKPPKPGSKPKKPVEGLQKAKEETAKKDTILGRRGPLPPVPTATLGEYDSVYDAIDEKGHIKRTDTERNTYVTVEARRNGDPYPPNLELRTVTDIPRDIAGLSVTQVAQCLKLLQLDSLIPGFEKDQINGSLMKALDPADLKEQYGVSGMVAKKVCLFAKGEWRPEK